MNRWKELSLVALAAGCLDPVVGGRCEDGWLMRDGRCAPDDAGPADARGSAVTPVVVPDGGAEDVASDVASPARDVADVPVADAASPDDARGDDAVADDGAVDAPVATADAAVPDVPLDAGIAASDAATSDARDIVATDAGDVGSAPDVPEAAIDVVPTDDAATDATTDDVAADAGGAPDDVTDGLGVIPADAGPAADAPPIACEQPAARCGEVCADLMSDPGNCGACGLRCASGEFCFSGTCAPQCPTPFTPCGASCVDLTADADNCGGCGVQCASGVCNAGICRQGRLGHLALIGHDYTVGRTAQNTIVGNAVFMAPTSSPRVLAVNTWSTAAAVNNTINAIQQVAAGVRRWSLQTVTDYAALSGALSVDTTDVVLVYAQNLADDAELGVAARIMGPAIGSFVRAGGVAIVLDGEGANAGTWQIATAAGLLSIDGRTVVTGETLTVDNGTDALGVGLPFEYRGERSTVAYFGTIPGIVVSAPGGAVVVHRGFLPRR